MSPLRILSAVVFCSLSATAAPSAARAAEPAAPPLAHFTFNGHARSDAPGAALWELRRTEFQDDALYLNGIYEFGPDPNGFHAVCRTPALQFTAFTATLRFLAHSFADDPARKCLLAGGAAHRWFVLDQGPRGNLRVSLNNGKFQRELPDAPLEVGKWTVVSCGVDLAAGRVAAYLNGKPVGEIALPDDFRLEVVGSQQEAADKVWCFANYASANVFHGLVDELIIHNRLLSAEEFAEEFRRVPRKRTDADAAPGKADGDADFLTAAERELVDLTNRERFKFGQPPLKASRQLTEAARGHAANMARQELLNHTLDGKTFDQRIEATGYRSSAAGENIWSAATASGAIEGWMSSPGHQRNLLSPEYQEIGVGLGVSKSQQKYWTQVFAKPDRPQSPRSNGAPRRQEK